MTRLLLAGVAAVLMGVAAEVSQTSSRLQIQIPTELFRPAGYAHQEALFGIPHYGGAIAQRLVYPGNYTDPYTLCSDSEADKFVNPAQPFILLVDRGGQDCTFVSKVRRAQHLGAAGVIIVDDRCICGDGACASAVACQPVEPIMADDGSGADITIPSFLMTKMDGNIIKSHLQANQFIQAEMTWSLPAPDDRVEWSLWTSAQDSAATAFKAEFRDVVTALGTHAYFTPHYIVYDGEEYGCRDDTNHCGNLCTNAGRYCNPDPDFDRDSGLSGADIIQETLRQKCIWLHYGGDKASKGEQGIGERWWTYVQTFSKKCGMGKFVDSSCISRAMSEAKINEKTINKCMDESGGLQGDIDNTLLSEELKEKANKSIVVIPTVYVNNVVERGGITAASVLTTICSGYAGGTEPKVCSCAGQGSSTAVKLCVRNGGKPPGGGGASGASTILGSVFAAMLVMGAAGFLYYRKSQEAMRDQVRGILAEYMPLDDMDAPGSNARVPFISHHGAGNGNAGNGGGYAAPKDTRLV
ncbi:hypothetical protein JKP88DRAFT_270825 [Tribonema minus]|uniref:PA domain-containing protein n=1 Tax=Tribonema minus TaxID=303371 RepID=A0A835YNB1_9STRA|nr:hypothetical protein JKP88DRAFT_270825 [Tribonema minus]